MTRRGSAPGGSFGGAALSARRLSPGAGGGFTVALVHGGLDTWETWRPLAARLDSSWRVFALDMPWRRGAPQGQWWRATPGAWVAEALDRLGEDLDLVVGHSLGANGVLEFLSLPRARACAAAALVAPWFPSRAEGADGARAVFTAVLRQVVVDRRGRNVDGETLARMARIAAERRWPEASGWLSMAAESFRQTPLSAVSTPILITANRDDPASPHSRARAVAATMPDARVAIMNGCGHFCHQGQAAQVARALASFLGDSRARASTVEETTLEPAFGQAGGMSRETL